MGMTGDWGGWGTGGGGVNLQSKLVVDLLNPGCCILYLKPKVT